MESDEVMVENSERVDLCLMCGSCGKLGVNLFLL